MNILTVALPIRLRARIIGRLKEHTVIAVANAAEAVEQMKKEPVQLLVYHEGDQDEDTLVALASFLPHHKSRVLFCAKQGHPAEFQNQLVKRLRVTAIMQHPVDPDELVRRVSIELDTAVPALESRVAPSPTIPKALLPVWQRHQETNRERAEILVNFCAEENPDEEWLEGARRAAHQLAGSMGTFGLHSASLLARDAENLIKGFAELTAEQKQRLQRVVHALELQVADPQLRLPDVENEAPKGSMLIFSIDQEWSESFAESAKQAGYQALITDDVSGARRVFGLEHPAKAVLDLGDMGQEGLALIHDLSGNCKLLALLEPGQSSALLACKSLTKPVAPSDILEALEQVPAAVAPAEPRRVLAVDDDPIVLETMAALLPALNIKVFPLSDPLNFWETLETVKPELIMLDVDLPYVGGVELCRALRAEPRFFDIPVIFLSAYNDAETVHRVFSAGADDYVFKPIIGPELLTRTRNRLLRAHHGQAPARVVETSAVEASSRPDVSLLVGPEEFSRDLFAKLTQHGLRVERLTQSGAALVEKLTCPVEERPRLMLLDALATNDVLQSLDGLGVNNYSQVWIRGDLNYEDIQYVYEWGMAGYLPEALSAETVVRKLERALKS